MSVDIKSPFVVLLETVTLVDILRAMGSYYEQRRLAALDEREWLQSNEWGTNECAVKCMADLANHIRGAPD